VFASSLVAIGLDMTNHVSSFVISSGPSILRGVEILELSCVSVCVCVRERERESVCVCM
jgi:hypothetical protein